MTTRASGPHAVPGGSTAPDRYRHHADHADLGLDPDADRTPDMRRAPSAATDEAQIHTSASQQKEKTMTSIARPTFPRTDRRDRTNDVLREHYGPEVQVVDAPLAWMPSNPFLENLGISTTEFVATARLIAKVVDCGVGDASNQLEAIGTAIEVMSR